MSTEPLHDDGCEGRSVDDLERLTGYLDGSLTPDEQAAMEARIADEADLRALLAALERADHALDELAPTPLPQGARERLDGALAAAFDELLPPHQPVQDRQRVEADDAVLAPTTAEAAGRTVDELSRRRHSGRRGRVVAVTAGAAAGVVLLAGGIVGLGQLSPTTDDRVAMQADSVEESAPEEAAALSGVDDDLAVDLPVVIDAGRAVDAEEQPELLDDPGLLALAQRGLSMEDGAALAAQVQQRVFDADAAPPAALPQELGRCLGELLDPGEQAVPVAIELVELDGGDAAIFGLLTLDPDSGAFSRIEAWTLSLDSCEVLRFDQS